DCYFAVAAWCSKALFCMNGCFHSQSIEYCESCHDCEFCFGCIGLRKKRYYILNKQYSEQEYWEKLDDIKCTMLEQEEYGDLPPLRFSPHRWQNSGMRTLYMVDEEEAGKLQANQFSFQSSGLDAVEQSGMSDLDELPDGIQDWDADKIASNVYFDKEYKRPFRYYKQEIEACKNLNIAPPRRHPSARVYHLIDQENKQLFIKAKCFWCFKEVTIAENISFPNRKTYCHDCYLQYLEKQG
ncbi:MAG: hypothetical protein ABIH21_00910, partial [Patescibacteria group bacterium]